MQELLGSLWAHVPLQPPSDWEQLAMLAAAFPSVVPLLPGALAGLRLVQLAGGHVEAGVGAEGGACWWQLAASQALVAAGEGQPFYLFPVSD